MAGFYRYRAIHSFFTRPPTLSQSTTLTNSRHISARVISGLNNSSREKAHLSRFYSTEPPKKDTVYDHGPQPSCSKCSPSRQPSPAQRPPDGPGEPPTELHQPTHYENYPRFFRRLAMSLPHLTRPTREDFLNAANGFGERMRVRFRWFFIRNFRKFNADDISAFITWFLMSQGLWILIGTTTFASVIFAVASSLRLQQYLARALSDYLTSETGVTIIFESAIVPKWKDSRISFKNVYITRRPPSGTIPARLTHSGHQAALGYDVSNHPANHAPVDEPEEGGMHGVAGRNSDENEHEEEDLKWSMFDLNIDSVDVTLSLWRWLDGKGLVQDAVVKGVRGVLDRRGVTWNPNLDPASFRHVSQPGDFELESLQLEDVLITVYQPGGFRPYTFSIFRADIGTFRKRWMFYDILKAQGIVGQFDNCLFSLHRPQSIGRTNEQDAKDGGWSTMSRIRIDGVNIDHIQSMTSKEGPISWITSGKLDAVLDIKFPRTGPTNDTLDVLIDALTDAVAPMVERIPGQRELAKPPLTVPDDDDPVGGRKSERRRKRKGNDEDEEVEEKEVEEVSVAIDLRFRDIKAAVPIWTNDLSYSSNALIRPIVAFMNANRTLIPIRCRVVKDLSDFDGAWTMWETGLMDDISLKVYDALAYHVTSANMNHRIKTVSLWSLQMTAGAALHALRNLMDPVTAQARDMYTEVASGVAQRVGSVGPEGMDMNEGMTVGEQTEGINEGIGLDVGTGAGTKGGGLVEVAV